MTTSVLKGQNNHDSRHDSRSHLHSKQAVLGLFCLLKFLSAIPTQYISSHAFKV